MTPLSPNKVSFKNIPELSPGGIQGNLPPENVPERVASETVTSQQTIPQETASPRDIVATQGNSYSVILGKRDISLAHFIATIQNPVSVYIRVVFGTATIQINPSMPTKIRIRIFGGKVSLPPIFIRQNVTGYQNVTLTTSTSPESIGAYAVSIDLLVVMGTVRIAVRQ